MTHPEAAPGPSSGPAPEPEYLTPAQVAALLQLSPKSIYRIAKADPTVPATLIGGSLRFHRARLERWLADRTQGTPRTRKQVLSCAKSASPGAPA